MSQVLTPCKARDTSSHFIFSVVLVVVITRSNVSCYDHYHYSQFVRTLLGLTNVPEDIPPEAREVFIGGNNITVLFPHSFVNLSQCVELDLSLNIIIDIYPRTFIGLVKLEQLV